MNLKEIISRHDRYPVDEMEMIFVVENYIKDRKGVNVNIDIRTNRNEISYTFQIHKLINAYNYAKIYHNNKHLDTKEDY